MRFIYALACWLVVGLIALFAAGYSGVYAVGADVPHWPVTLNLIAAVRDRAVARRTADLKLPVLDDPAMIARGARLYARDCAACHLAPGTTASALHDDLYPRPPALPNFHPAPAYSFWAIKHGFKMTAMPAWGKTLDDGEIWSLVAYLERQPGMSVEAYRALSGAPAPGASASSAGRGPNARRE
jgi:mono/diheme cytochrome c family protein